MDLVKLSLDPIEATFGTFRTAFCNKQANNISKQKKYQVLALALASMGKRSIRPREGNYSKKTFVLGSCHIYFLRYHYLFPS